MKNNIILGAFFFFAMVFFTNCSIKYPTTKQSGKEDIAYITFVSEGNKSYTINVQIDDNTTFTAKTVKAKKANIKGNLYSAKTGKRKISISHDGKKVYEKLIFLSPQETKTILLQ